MLTSGQIGPFYLNSFFSGEKDCYVAEVSWGEELVSEHRSVDSLEAVEKEALDFIENAMRVEVFREVYRKLKTGEACVCGVVIKSS